VVLRALLTSENRLFASVYRATVRTVRVQRMFAGFPKVLVERRRAGLAAGPALASCDARTSYFLVTEMLVMSMIPISKSSAVSVTPFTYGFKRYFVDEK
jgi:hypothetical protein